MRQVIRKAAPSCIDLIFIENSPKTQLDSSCFKHQLGCVPNMLFVILVSSIHIHRPTTNPPGNLLCTFLWIRSPLGQHFVWSTNCTSEYACALYPFHACFQSLRFGLRLIKDSLLIPINNLFWNLQNVEGKSEILLPSTYRRRNVKYHFISAWSLVDF